VITFSAGDFSLVELPLEGAMIMMNPPYGERLRVDDASGLYEKIGEKLKHRFMGNTAWILSSSNEHFHKIGLKPSAKIKLYNGALECSFQKFELFEGKRKMLVKKK
jgi:putative N6-adenine-specific DNA methylase